MNCTFEYGVTRVRDLHIVQQRRAAGGKLLIERMEVAGRPVQPTRRFWRSLFHRFGVADNVFRYFDPVEVFQRIAHRAPDDALRFCVESAPEKTDKLLAVTGLKRPVLEYADARSLIDEHDGGDVQYGAGVLTSTHRPRSGQQPLAIGGDEFRRRFVLETPIDGFGQPRLFLSFLRLICGNGMIGYSRAFRSDVSLGKDLGYSIARALESYDNGEGYSALRQRFESAQTSWASVRECVLLYKLLLRHDASGELGAHDAPRKFYRLSGRLNELYGLANLDALSVKRQRILPAECRVYDLLNFASEAATHYAAPPAARALQAYLGSLISDEYDMEGTADTAPEFRDFFLADGEPGPRRSVN